ncbi:MAG: preprotein translocase subunit SecE [Christensenellales bacterium]
MSEKKKVPSKAAGADKKPNFLQKVLDFFVKLPKRVAQPFKNMWRELKKVTWPTRKDLLNYTLIVLAFMAFMGAVIGLLDLGSSKLIALLIG